MKAFDQTAKSRFELGRQVNFALPRPMTLKPTSTQIKAAAQSIGITQAEAWRAWNEFTWG